jgi:diguanylate cyclase (GGDEF)-like protein
VPAAVGFGRWGAALARVGREAWARAFGGDAIRFEEALHRFTAEMGIFRNPAAIEAALIRLAHRIAPSSRFELIRTAAEPAAWESEGRRRAGTDGPGQAEHGKPRPDECVDEIPMCCGPAVLGVLRATTPAAPGHATPGVETLRRLTTACTLAACALENARWLAASTGEAQEHDHGRLSPSDAEASVRPLGERPGVVRDATFLNAVIPFALAQARRHREPASLLCVQLDRLRAIRGLLGQEVVDRLIQDLARTVASVVRASDIVARLDDDRVVALLIRARGADALGVAQTICRTVAESGLAVPELPGVTVSIGVAEFPSSARDASTLLEVADEALDRATTQGRNQAVLAESDGESMAAAAATAEQPVAVG